MTPIDTLFDLMDTWRHFPSYQIERRADLTFALYLPEVLEATLGVPIHPGLVPEFPARIGTIYPNEKTYSEDANIITFRDFAEVVRLHEDAVSQRFARSLRRWAEIEAGAG